MEVIRIFVFFIAYNLLQVNAWDQLLLKNGEKILALNESVSSVRQDQQRLEHELDFVAGQQVKQTSQFSMYILAVVMIIFGWSAVALIFTQQLHNPDLE